MSTHTEDLVKLAANAKRRYAPKASSSAESLALYIQAVIQGAFILAKAKNGPDVAAECFTRLRRYFEMLFHQRNRMQRPPVKAPFASGRWMRAIVSPFISFTLRSERELP
jgi:TetR/AcrR family transcriptional regulator, transcriptional repressor for nem operon